MRNASAWLQDIDKAVLRSLRTGSMSSQQLGASMERTSGRAVGAAHVARELSLVAPLSKQIQISPSADEGAEQQQAPASLRNAVAVNNDGTQVGNVTQHGIPKCTSLLAAKSPHIGLFTSILDLVWLSTCVCNFDMFHFCVRILSLLSTTARVAWTGSIQSLCASFPCHIMPVLLAGAIL